MSPFQCEGDVIPSTVNVTALNFGWLAFNQLDHDLGLATWQDLLLGNGHEEASGRTLLRDDEAGFA